MSYDSFKISHATGQPFEKCSVCEQPLKNSPYYIEKVFQRNPLNKQHFVLFEYAMCLECKRNMMQEISEESMKKIQELSAKINAQSQVEEVLHNQEFSPDHCSFTHKPISDMEEYHTVFIVGDFVQYTPIIFGSEMIEQYSEVLSEKTRGFFDDFFNQFIDIPPSLAKVLQEDFKPVIF